MEYLHFEERVITSNWELRKMESHPYYEIYIFFLKADGDIPTFCLKISEK